MVSLMPVIPNTPPTNVAPVAFVRQRGQRYSVQDLEQVPVEKLTKGEIVAELRYLHDNLDYRGSRDVRNLAVGRALLTEAGS